jgi:hypothetical protein
MKEIFKASPWVELDIFKMADKEIKEKANSVLEWIAAFVIDKKLMKYYRMPTIQVSITIIFVQEKGREH